jgi:alkylated DNA nucleotide flippase Atl1
MVPVVSDPQRRRGRVAGPRGGPEGFTAAVLAAVEATRPGEVLTYGEVAAEVGSPGAARAVGQVLRQHGHVVPWWRVVTARGRLVPGAEQAHRARLLAEGVACTADAVHLPR